MPVIPGSDDRVALRVSGVAETLGVNVETVRRALARGALAGRKLNGQPSTPIPLPADLPFRVAPEGRWPAFTRIQVDIPPNVYDVTPSMPEP